MPPHWTLSTITTQEPIPPHTRSHRCHHRTAQCLSLSPALSRIFHRHNISLSLNKLDKHSITPLTMPDPRRAMRHDSMQSTTSIGWPRPPSPSVSISAFSAAARLAGAMVLAPHTLVSPRQPGDCRPPLLALGMLTLSSRPRQPAPRSTCPTRRRLSRARTCGRR
jgi:hypothetical protein